MPLELIGQVLGIAFLWIGVLFSVVGVVGTLRFPDVFTRLHASGKVSALGLVGLLLGTMILLPGSALKLILLLMFIILTAPVSSHAIAVAAVRSGLNPDNPTANLDPHATDATPELPWPGK